jgi:hypothetical protein
MFSHTEPFEREIKKSAIYSSTQNMEHIRIDTKE